MDLMEQIRALYARLAELTAEELTELFGLITQANEDLAGEATSTEVVEATQELATIFEAATAENGTRETAAAELETERQAAQARLAGEQSDDSETNPEGDDAGDGDDAGAGDDAGDDAGSDADGDDAGDASGDAGADAGDVAEPIAAGGAPAAPRPRPALSNRGTSPARPAAPRGPAARTAPVGHALTASADVRGAGVGSEFATEAQLAQAMSRTLQSMGHGGGSGHTLLPIAHSSVGFPESRQLTKDPEENDGRILAHLRERHEAMAALRGQGPDAIVAAGGLCAPAETNYDIRVLGSVARPVRGSLPSFAATRGAVELRPNISYRTAEGAITDWTMANDANPTTPATKNIIDITCPTPFTETVEGGVLRLRFHNVTSRFDPEVVAANTRAAQVAFARHQENKLLVKIDAKLKTMTQPKVLGATRDILALVDKAQAYLRSRYRLEDAVPLACILPQWVKELIRTDITRQMATDLEALAVADGVIEGWFSRRNVAVTWHLDGSEADVAAGGGAPRINRQSYANVATNGVLPGYPDDLVVRLFTDGDLLYLTGGSLDLGVVRDSAHNDVNTYETFFEEFDGVAWRGEEGLKVVAVVQPTGGSAGTVDTSAIAD